MRYALWLYPIKDNQRVTPRQHLPRTDILRSGCGEKT